MENGSRAVSQTKEEHRPASVLSAKDFPKPGMEVYPPGQGNPVLDDVQISILSFYHIGSVIRMKGKAQFLPCHLQGLPPPDIPEREHDGRYRSSKEPDGQKKATMVHVDVNGAIPEECERQDPENESSPDQQKGDQVRENVFPLKLAINNVGDQFGVFIK